MWPEDAIARADADRWMDWPMLVQPYMTTLNVGLIRTPSEQRDMSKIEVARRAAADIWAVLDKHLRDRDFVAGSQLTIGDIAIGNLAYRWFNLDVEREEMPGLQSWYRRLSERQAFQTEVMRPLA
jgi:glutathione S-transferase